MMDEWRVVAGTNGCYECSNAGFIRSVERVVNFGCGTRIVRPRILKQKDNKHGYMYVDMSVNNSTIRKYVHRIVAESFIENPFNKPEVNHKDLVRNHNSVNNLEWATASENNRHSLRFESSKKGDNSNLSRYTEKFIEFIREKVKYSGLSQAEISRTYGISKAHVCRINKGMARKIY